MDSVDEQRRIEVLKRIQQGETVSSPNEIPTELINLLILTISIQYWCEFWGGKHYLFCVPIAPDREEKDFIFHTGNEELGHAKILLEGPLKALGVIDLVPAQSAKLETKVLSIFQYPEKFLEGWAWVRMFNFLQDRAAGIQLARFKRGPFKPWNDAILRIEEEEKSHVSSGEEAIVRLASYGIRLRYALQKALDFWLPLTLEGFGGPDATSRLLPLYRAYGLKDSNDGDRGVFIGEIKPILDACDLSHALIIEPEILL